MLGPPRPTAQQVAGVDTPRSIGHNRVLRLSDFAHPELAAAARAVFPHEVARFGPGFPHSAAYRKHWEIAMAVRALVAHGAVRDDARLLGVAAGNEPTIFWLTNHVARVVATDRYLDPGVWSEFADATMVTDPGRHWPGAWDPRRLAVEHMDALDLAFDDETFDGVFSSSSIEHFGGIDELTRAMAEIHRVLRPGGVAALSTEFRLAGPAPGIQGALLLDARDIHEHIVGDLRWSLTSPLEEPNAAERDELVELAFPALRYVEELREHFAATGGLFLLHQLRYSRYPQVALRLDDHVWTSVHVTIRRE